MAKGLKDPKQIFPEIISEYKALFGDDLISIILYGSAAGQNYLTGKSDINFMILLSEQGLERLDRAFGTVQKWRKKNVAIPLFLTEAYVETSLDVFPIEYYNLQKGHVLVFGKDILVDLVFHKKDMRLQCERELKGKLLLLREAFIETAGRGDALKGVMTRSLTAFVAIFKGLLFLKDVEAPEDRPEMIKKVCEIFGLEFSTFQKLLDIKAGTTKPSAAELKKGFQEYLKEINTLSKGVDAMGGENE